MRKSRIKWIKDSETIYALIIGKDYDPTATTFLTPGSFDQQIGCVVYAEGETIAPHKHKMVQRTIQGTSETLLVKKGKVEVSIYDEGDELFFRGILNGGDMIALISGGHGFKMLEDTILIEVKQGPYLGDDDKVILGERV